MPPCNVSRDDALVELLRPHLFRYRLELIAELEATPEEDEENLANVGEHLASLNSVLTYCYDFPVDQWWRWTKPAQ